MNQRYASTVDLGGEYMCFHSDADYCIPVATNIYRKLAPRETSSLVLSILF
jgi:hypothetical protein